MPCSVCATSGWNCTAISGRVRCAIAATAQVDVAPRTSKPGRRGYLIAMVHPDLQLAVQIGEERMGMNGSKSRESVLALFAFPDAAAQHVSHELLAVADAEHGAAGGENVRIDLGTAGLVDAVRAAGDDDSFAAGQLGGRCFAGLDVGVHAEIANLPGDEMTILSARIEDGDLWGIQPLASVADLSECARRSASSTCRAAPSRRAWRRWPSAPRDRFRWPPSAIPHS